MSDLTGELIDNRYLLQRRLAAGGMATIYAGIDTRLDRPVAVKIMHAHLANDEAFVSRFIKEAKATAADDRPDPGGPVKTQACVISWVSSPVRVARTAFSRISTTCSWPTRSA